MNKKRARINFKAVVYDDGNYDHVLWLTEYATSSTAPPGSWVLLKVVAELPTRFRGRGGRGRGGGGRGGARGGEISAAADGTWDLSTLSDEAKAALRASLG